MSDLAFYLTLAAIAFLGLSAALADRRRRKRLPPRTPRQKWLAVRMSIGALLLAIAIVVGSVPFLFAVMYLDASDSGAHNHRDSLIVIIVEIAMLLIGLALYVPAKRELRRSESRPTRVR